MPQYKTSRSASTCSRWHLHEDLASLITHLNSFGQSLVSIAIDGDGHAIIDLEGEVLTGAQRAKYGLYLVGLEDKAWSVAADEVVKFDSEGLLEIAKHATEMEMRRLIKAGDDAAAVLDRAMAVTLDAAIVDGKEAIK